MNDLSPRVPNRPLLWDDSVLDLQDFLIESGFKYPVHIVGGAVRDAYLHFPVKDLDLVTVAGRGIGLARRIADHFKGDVFIMDAERDVARALIDTPQGRLNVDVSGYRGDSLLIDLQERDFTFNAMAVDLLRDVGKLVDPLEGERDLQAKVLRACSPHAIEADPIRALRAVRQSVQLGTRIEPETLAQIRAHSARLADISPERVRDELYKIFDLAKPSAVLRIADTLNLIDPILPDLNALKVLQVQDGTGWTHALNVIERLVVLFSSISPYRTDETAATFNAGIVVMGLDRFRAELWTHLAERMPNDRSVWGLHMLAALIFQLPQVFDHVTADSAAEYTMDALRLSVQERQRLAAMISGYQHEAFTGDETVEALTAHRYWRTFGSAGIDVIIFMLAQIQAQFGPAMDQDAWIKQVARSRSLLEAYFTQHDTIVAPPPVMDGAALMQQLGLNSGRVIGELLTLIREAQVTGAVTNVQDALSLARAYLDQGYSSDKSNNRA